MRGLLVIGCFLLFWIGAGVLEDIDRKDFPFQIDQDDLAVLSGYNYMHAVMDNDLLLQLNVYDQNKQLVKTYYASDLNELVPSAAYKQIVEENEKLFVLYEENDTSISRKKLVVGPRGSLTFVPERY
ncbi:hypothetical protein JI666_03440 [Bacillus sp. NTK071]|uniref:hypothetical protein n=1 Tax=Bacillus sp. NTK071 TaxID=2802175 RepID=UPI001A90BCD4|nr:hypothetical protein [Bacillus sp. NTK071]MBN8207797.1 hypothetical protein [Bacillus sp. NTK071]